MTAHSAPQSSSAPRPADAPAIELQDVHVVHRLRSGGLFRPDTIRAVDGVSLSVRRGEVLGVVGESGSGKSTLARVMTGLQPVTAGRVTFDGLPLSRDRASRRELGRKVSVVFQDPSTALNPRLPVRETLMDPLRVHGIGTEPQRLARVKELLHLVGLPQSAVEVLPRQISGGQRQRVAIARALALEPQIIVADEPTSALDVSVRAQVLNLLTDLKRELGLGLVFITHDMSTVRFISDSLIVMHRGKVVEHGTTAQIFSEAKDDYTRSLLAAAPSLL
ncbi:ABC transporter ATP-binding protein [Brachybacterium saurashtrense]|uniref:ABC transporter ATP-binding protein n=1 Tax=Brachybacterium saurashtrense TaxID=556288 RepID=A0A345YKG2_9MICO|nr:ATP-binding cassette domain-containing protein [Brachybacterium saurashtrense]AXK44414.1 ABC transporter ATP-binding protein [Brachybacterium saurashtrense]RRR23025.1 ABC transporter ATP-binding protein [Brachybacterium saurashtrense]